MIEQCPMTLFSKMKNTPNIKLKKNSLYLNKREELIRNMRTIFNKLKFRNQTFYLSIHLLDLIMSCTKDSKMELISIICLILAGKIILNKLNLMKTIH